MSTESMLQQTQLCAGCIPAKPRASGNGILVLYFMFQLWRANIPPNTYLRQWIKPS